MRILHLLRSAPDEMVRTFIDEISKNHESMEIPLYQGETDYDQVIQGIFEHQKVISWW